MSDYDHVKDSGTREQFPSGAVRDTQDGKPRPDRVLYWLPIEALERVATHYENGARKYDRDNWRKGIPASRCLASAFRHLFQWMLGDWTEDHLSAVVFNVLCIITWEQTGRTDLLDNGPSPKVAHIRPECVGRPSGPNGRYSIGDLACRVCGASAWVQNIRGAFCMAHESQSWGQ